MSNTPDSSPGQAIGPKSLAAGTMSPGNRGRRRLVVGVTGGVGVLLAVQAKTALGNTVCQSPSAMMSGNASPNPNPPPCSGGRSPGFWKVPKHFAYWPLAGATYPIFTQGIGECGSGGLKGLNDYDKVKDLVINPGTLVRDLFPGALVPGPAQGFPETGIWAVMAFPTYSGFNADGNGQFIRHLSAAWLNAGTFPDYPLTRPQIRAMWESAGSGGLYYPNGGSGTSGGMSRQDIIDYIDGMYDFNAELEPALCTDSSPSSTSFSSSLESSPDTP